MSTSGPRPALRPEQDEIARYGGGLLRVSAVPGSGKTQTLAALVARLLRGGRVPPDGEILVVTFTNSAVDNIRARIRAMLVAAGGVPDVGYRVLTLHGLAYLVIRERPDLAGADSAFAVDDEVSGRQAIPEAVRRVRAGQEAYWRSFIREDLVGPQRDRAEDRWASASESLARDVIRQAKNMRWTSAKLDAALIGLGRGPGAPEVSPFLRLGARIYREYEDILRAGGRLDFDDLIWRAVDALDNDDAFRRRLGQRFCYILEDEAQDSTPLQEEILSRLCREHGNWARVGDPNQAIMTTFTASSVRFFRDEFPRRPGVRNLPLSLSGRSAPAIIRLANRLAAWAEREHPEVAARGLALTAETLIQPTGPGDPQANPPDSPGAIVLKRFDDEDDQAAGLAKGALDHLRRNPDQTCAILVPTNRFGQQVVSALERLQPAGEPPRFEDHLNNSLAVRNVADLVARGVAMCASPQKGNALAELRLALRALAEPGASRGRSDVVDRLLRSAKVERLLFPSPAAEPALPPNVDVSPEAAAEIDALSARAAKWVRASALPIDQLILTIAHDAFTADADLAIAHSLAVSMRRLAALNPRWDLSELSEELSAIAASRQQFLSRTLIEAGFVARPGIVTVTTMHKAKGLEWDRVYLACVDTVEFPDDVGASFRGEMWFLPGRPDPGLEARAQLEEVAAAAREGRAPDLDAQGLTRAARLEYIAERLRLLYVGLTRARRELRLSWSERRPGGANAPALAALAILKDHE